MPSSFMLILCVYFYDGIHEGGWSCDKISKRNQTLWSKAFSVGAPCKVVKCHKILLFCMKVIRQHLRGLLIMAHHVVSLADRWTALFWNYAYNHWYNGSLGLLLFGSSGRWAYLFGVNLLLCRIVVWAFGWLSAGLGFESRPRCCQLQSWASNLTHMYLQHWALEVGTDQTLYALLSEKGRSQIT